MVEFDLPARAATPDYLGDVKDWHDGIAAAWAREIAEHLPGGGIVALLVWGDPSLYDSSLRIAEQLRVSGMALEVRVVPGITSIQALTAAHAIPLNRLGAPVTITPARRLRETGWPTDTDSIVVMLDADCAFATLPPGGIEIWWGAYLGLPQEVLIHGPLADVACLITERRAALRHHHGWIMDIYLMRRSTQAHHREEK